MAVKKLYDLAVKTGSYTNKQGEQKNRYQNVGALMQSDNGKFLFLEKSFNPAGIESQQGSSSIIVSMFEPRENNKQGQQQNNAPQQQNNNNGGQQFDSDSEIPF